MFVIRIRPQTTMEESIIYMVSYPLRSLTKSLHRELVCILEKVNVRCVNITCEQSLTMRDEAIAKFHSDDLTSPKVLVATHASIHLVNISAVCNDGIIIGAVSSLSQTYSTVATLLDRYKTKRVNWSLFHVRDSIDEVLEARAWAEYQEKALSDKSPLYQYNHFNWISSLLSQTGNRWLWANLYIPMGRYHDGVIRTIHRGLEHISALAKQGSGNAGSNDEEFSLNTLLVEAVLITLNSASHALRQQMERNPTDLIAGRGRLASLSTVGLIIAGWSVGNRLDRNTDDEANDEPLTEDWVMRYADFNQDRMADCLPRWLVLQLSEPIDGKPNIAQGYAYLHQDVRFGGDDVNTATPVPADAIQNIIHLTSSHEQPGQSFDAIEKPKGDEAAAQEAVAKKNVEETIAPKVEAKAKKDANKDAARKAEAAVENNKEAAAQEGDANKNDEEAAAREAEAAAKNAEQVAAQEAEAKAKRDANKDTPRKAEAEKNAKTAAARKTTKKPTSQKTPTQELKPSAAARADSRRCMEMMYRMLGKEMPTSSPTESSTAKGQKRSAPDDALRTPMSKC